MNIYLSNNKNLTGLAPALIQAWGNILGYNLVIFYEKPQRWQIFDVTTNLEGEYVGIICDGGSGCIDGSLKIAFFLEKNYQRKGLGTKILEKFINDLSPASGEFEARGQTPASQALVKSFGFTFNDQLLTWTYRK